MTYSFPSLFLFFFFFFPLTCAFEWSPTAFCERWSWCRAAFGRAWSFYRPPRCFPLRSVGSLIYSPILEHV
ncbi:hypothetical protein BDY21DRAFT_331097 [Lineolata rhizophorae]|uniref:Secreted protein n=1 Tax=Lineolata rhizophorae TaxID=578093 RepID=A0A6A6PEZ2_9PEZI|nr:hypothetical protein BDY21DRAFT_331097 [Lineolata rhizophorae]